MHKNINQRRTVTTTTICLDFQGNTYYTVYDTLEILTEQKCKLYEAILTAN